MGIKRGLLRRNSQMGTKIKQIENLKYGDIIVFPVAFDEYDGKWGILIKKLPNSRFSIYINGRIKKFVAGDFDEQFNKAEVVEL